MFSDRLKQIAQSFGRRADDYDRNAPLQKECAAQLAALLPHRPAPDVLEIGCGTGFVTEHLINDCYPDGTFVITDIAQEMVAVAERKYHYPNAVFKVMDGQAPAVDRMFDVIVSGMAVQWFDNPHASLERLRDMLLPNGVLYYSAPGPDSFAAWRDVLKEEGLSDGLLSYPAWPGVVKSQTVTVDYGRVENFLKSLKEIGAHQPRKGYAALHPAALRKACRLYNERHGGKVTWEIVYGCLQAAA